MHDQAQAANRLTVLVENPGGGVRLHSKVTTPLLPGSGVLACFLSFIICTALALSFDRFDHWFMIPLGICCATVGKDALEWIRGKLDLYDIGGLIGLYGLHFFFIAPILHVLWNEFIPDVAPPPDWRDWLGRMGVLNAIGLIGYRVIRDFPASKPVRTTKTYWVFDLKQVRVIGLLLLFLSAASQIAVYIRFGGVVAYMNARLADPGTFTGMGWIFMVSESFPILLAFTAIAYTGGRKADWSTIVAGLIALFALQLFFGGLRGSRSQTVQTLIWIVGCIHLLVRPVPRSFVFIGAPFLLLFMYVYGFYKNGGVDAVLDAMGPGPQEREYMEQKTGRTFDNVILGDLARADVQAYILYALRNEPEATQFRYAWGRTYLGALSLPIPHWILSERPETKLKEGTEIQSGPGSYVPKILYSSRVYGFAGESMLNFGPFSVPFAYTLFGLVIRCFTLICWRLPKGDSRLVLVPFAVYTLCVAGIGADSDNLVFGVIKDGLMPTLMVILCSKRVPLFKTSSGQ
jgi:hypothetical protein